MASRLKRLLNTQALVPIPYRGATHLVREVALMLGIRILTAGAAVLGQPGSYDTSHINCDSSSKSTRYRPVLLHVGSATLSHCESPLMWEVSAAKGESDGYSSDAVDRLRSALLQI